MDFSALLNFILLGAAGIIFWRQGGNRAATEVITTYKEQVSQLKEENKDIREKHLALSREVTENKAIIQQKAEENSRYLKILENRNPEMVEFMKTITSVADKALDFMAAQIKEVAEIKKDLETIKKKLDITD